MSGLVNHASLTQLFYITNQPRTHLNSLAVPIDMEDVRLDSWVAVSFGTDVVVVAAAFITVESLLLLKQNILVIGLFLKLCNF